MTTTEAPAEPLQLGVLCHCTGDDEGHAPGADAFGCAPFKRSRPPVDPRDWEPSHTYAELARVASTPAERNRWKAVAAFHKGIEAFWTEVGAREHRVRRALKVVKAGGARWAILHVPSDTMLIGGYATKREADEGRDALLDVTGVRWTEQVLSDRVRLSVAARAKAEPAHVIASRAVTG